MNINQMISEAAAQGRVGDLVRKMANKRGIAMTLTAVYTTDGETWSGLYKAKAGRFVTALLSFSNDSKKITFVKFIDNWMPYAGPMPASIIDVDTKGASMAGILPIVFGVLESGAIGIDDIQAAFAKAAMYEAAMEMMECFDIKEAVSDYEDPATNTEALFAELDGLDLCDNVGDKFKIDGFFAKTNRDLDMDITGNSEYGKMSLSRTNKDDIVVLNLDSEACAALKLGGGTVEVVACADGEGWEKIRIVESNVDEAAGSSLKGVMKKIADAIEADSDVEGNICCDDLENYIKKYKSDIATAVDREGSDYESVSSRNSSCALSADIDGDNVAFTLEYGGDFFAVSFNTRSKKARCMESLRDELSNKGIDACVIEFERGEERSVAEALKKRLGRFDKPCILEKKNEVALMEYRDAVLNGLKREVELIKSTQR